MPTSPMPSPSPIYQHLKQAVLKAGDLAMEYFGGDVKIETKDDGSKVSEADYAVNELLERELTSFDEGIAWLSEESPIDQSRLDKSRVWIIDPIDGTHAFLRHDPDWTIVAGLIEDNKAILGAVYNPVTNELYMAEKGCGATLNDTPIKVTDNKDMGKATIISSKPHFKRVFMEDRTPPSWSWRCSMAYRIVLIANGTADATISLTPKNDWDIAAAHIILEEAGGIMTTQNGDEMFYNKENTRHSSVVGSNKALYDSIIAKSSIAPTASGPK